MTIVVSRHNTKDSISFALQRMTQQTTACQQSNLLREPAAKSVWLPTAIALLIRETSDWYPPSLT
jgi:hypothetical protein